MLLVVIFLTEFLENIRMVICGVIMVILFLEKCSILCFM